MTVFIVMSFQSTVMRKSDLTGFCLFVFVSRFACPCGFLGQSGVKVLTARRTLRQSLRYRLPLLTLVVQGMDGSYLSLRLVVWGGSW